MDRANLTFHPEAAGEFALARSWYEERASGLGAVFEAEIQRTLDRITEAPERWPVYRRPPYRKAMTRRFPYSVIFEIVEGRIGILAVAHGHRRPGYWLSRRATRR